MERRSVEQTSVTYEASNAEGDRMYMWCNLHVNEFACVFMLSAQHLESYETIHAVTLTGFKRRRFEVTCFGRVPHSLNAEPQQDFMKLCLLRSLSTDFLIDAGTRVKLAQTL